MALLLALFLLGQDFSTPTFFAKPVDWASAREVGKDVVVTVSYAGEIPVRACTALFDAEDANLINERERHCWTPTNIIADFDVWEKRTLQDMGSILCSITYKNGNTVYIYLAYQES